jgi:hypothetical protein
MKVRAAEELLGVTRKLKQLWILSEARQKTEEDIDGVDTRLQINDIALKLREILEKSRALGDGEMDEIQLAKQEGSENVIEIE